MADLINESIQISTIVAGDNNIVFRFTIKDSEGTIVNLTGATVVVTIDNGSEKFIKNASIDTPLTGVCYIVLTQTELVKGGLQYRFQLKTTLLDGAIHGSQILSFYVEEKL